MPFKSDDTGSSEILIPCLLGDPEGEGISGSFWNTAALQACLAVIWEVKAVVFHCVLREILAKEQLISLLKQNKRLS